MGVGRGRVSIHHRFRVRRPLLGAALGEQEDRLRIAGRGGRGGVERYVANAGIANAFALPSGDILVTDRLVEMAEKPEVLDAILLHEIGHVVNRHGMRQVIQSSALTILLILVVGDVGAVEEWILALPGFLLESNYSRGFESEVDEYAFERMLAMGMDPAHFGRMLGRIRRNGGVIEDGAVQDPGAKSWLEYLSSHPGTPNRIEQARRYSEIFRNR